MISGIFISNSKGDVLVTRQYRPDVKRSSTDIFRIHVVSTPNIRSPILTIEKTTFYHIKHQNIYIVAISTQNVNAALVFEFLNRIASLGTSYFGIFNEESVKSNFTLVYELFDEICDFGFPQTTEADTLKLYITTETIRNDKKVDASRIAIQATGAVSYRRPDIKYRKNECFVDVIESINLIMSAKGTVLRSDVTGQVIMRAYLSGMPECKLGLNDKVGLEKQGKLSPKKTNAVELDDVQFHQCVKLSKFDQDRTITFVPPDGEFELLRYRTTDNVSLPFKVNAIVNELSESKVEFKIAVKAQFASKIRASNVVIKIPTPLNTAHVKFQVTNGRAKYNGGENAIVWKISSFSGDQEILLTAIADLTVTLTKKAWIRPPISLDFQVFIFNDWL